MNEQGSEPGEQSTGPDAAYHPESWAGTPYAPTQSYPYYGGYPYYGQPYSDQPVMAPVGSPGQRPSRSRRLALLIIAAAVAAAAVFGVGLAVGSTITTDGTPVASQQIPSTGGGSGQTIPALPMPTVPTNPFGTGGPSGGNTTSSSQASVNQSAGVVDIYTRLGYQGAQAAGTGVVIGSDGFVLTNNHVVSGATKIRVVVASTGRSYPATVVGTAPTEDVAVLKLPGASGLRTANLGNSDSVRVGDKVTGVGNAGGAGGTPSAARGVVTSLHNTITASDQSGTDSERLSGIIATNAPIRSGDSGGPLYNADDKVIGIDTAASTGGRSAGFAIPINKALHIASQIRKGVETSVIHIGYPAFLGVSLASQSTNGGGALIGSVIPGLPAAKAGIVAGDVITKIDGTAVANYAQLRQAVAKLNPGDKATLTYTDQAGASHSATVTTITGPAD